MFEKIKQLMTWIICQKAARQVYIDDLRVIATVFVIGVHTVSLAATMTEYGSIPFRVLTILILYFVLQPAFVIVKRSIIASGKN